MPEPQSVVVETGRLLLSPPLLDDVPALFGILGDPSVWQHFPSRRHTSRSQTRAAVQRWIDGWTRNGLDTWVVRFRDAPALVGYGGCSVLQGQVWNLGYRLAAAEHGRGYATEIARAALEHARRQRAELPVVAYLLEHNAASANVARKIGLTLIDRCPDSGNPDPDAVRLIFADRPLDPQQLAAARH